MSAAATLTLNYVLFSFAVYKKIRFVMLNMKDQNLFITCFESKCRDADERRSITDSQSSLFILD